MSEIIKELESFAKRLEKDGYPPALIQRAAQRMKAMENEIMRLHNLNVDLQTKQEELE